MSLVEAQAALPQNWERSEILALKFPAILQWRGVDRNFMANNDTISILEI